ncbi:hypothetical protein C4F50_10095 [Flavobacterium sp. KB82]|uniref:Uncharacterized protein n=1 Tax=Flavobacterium hungaricum TaxID=2082725 RepID=A0ABR9TIX0_9FLAO|nr:hypothetical protein [Flavobacterium hungaricum]
MIFGLFLNNYHLRSQTSKEAEIYNWFDKNIGIESLDIKNGAAHLNFDNTVENQNRYYFTENFRKGTLRYNNQNYYDVLLKYDIYKDDLVLNPYDEANTTKINLIKDNVENFSINNEKFINLKVLNPSFFKGGFYEEVLINSTSALYIKYFKEKKKDQKEESNLIQYIPRYEFVLLKDSKYYLINGKKEIIALFPESKRKINDYYFMNKSLKKENPALFIKNLVKYINN